MANEEILLHEDLNGYDNLEIFGDDRSKIKTLAVELDGIKTDFVLCDYSERQFFIITQYQKIGTLISVVRGVARTLNGNDNVYDLKIISGLDSEEYHLVARYLAEQLNIRKPILFGISLKDHNLKTLQTIVKVLKENNFF